MGRKTSTQTWLSSTYHSVERKRCDNGSRGWYGFFCPGKKPISLGHVGDTAFFARAKIPYHHIRSTRRSSTFGAFGGLFGALGGLAVLLIRYQIDKLVRQKACMINRLRYGNFHIIYPHINPRPISARGPLALGLIWVSRVDMGYDMKIAI